MSEQDETAILAAIESIVSDWSVAVGFTNDSDRGNMRRLLRNHLLPFDSGRSDHPYYYDLLALQCESTIKICSRDHALLAGRAATIRRLLKENAELRAEARRAEARREEAGRKLIEGVEGLAKELANFNPDESESESENERDIERELVEGMEQFAEDLRSGKPIKTRRPCPQCKGYRLYGGERCGECDGTGFAEGEL